MILGALKLIVSGGFELQIHSYRHARCVGPAMGWETVCKAIHIVLKFLFQIVTGGFKSLCRRRLCMILPLTHAHKLASESSKNSFLHKWQASDSRISLPLIIMGLFHREVDPCEIPFVVWNYTIYVISLHFVVHAWRECLNLKRAMSYFSSSRAKLITPCLRKLACQNESDLSNGLKNWKICHSNLHTTSKRAPKTYWTRNRRCCMQKKWSTPNLNIMSELKDSYSKFVES